MTVGPEKKFGRNELSWWLEVVVASGRFGRRTDRQTDEQAGERNGRLMDGRKGGTDRQAGGREGRRTSVLDLNNRVK